jgi:sorting nexin-8
VNSLTFSSNETRFKKLSLKIFLSKMVKKRELKPKPILDEKMLTDAFNANGISLKHAATIWRNIIQHGVTDLSTINTLPKKALALIESEFTISTSKVISRTDAKDFSTTKLLIELQDGSRIESVIMRYGDVTLDSFPADEKERKTKDGEFQFKSKKRATLCVSSQVGCAMGCTFCGIYIIDAATGTMNLLANLEAGEILEQLYHANKVEKIRNIVFMGMGEPLDNYEAVLSAVRAMVDTARFGLSPSRVSISTVGVVPRMKALINDLPDIGLALSLHAPTQDLRVQIVPTSKAWHIEKIMKAADEFVANQNKDIKSKNRKRHVLIEYVIIRDINDSEETAHNLGALLKGRDVLLNVIPYNPTAVPFDYKPPLPATCSAFVKITRETYGIHTLFRQEMGQDISSACGQLVIDSQKQGCNDSLGDIEDLGRNSSSKLRKPVKKSGKTKESVSAISWVPNNYLAIAAVAIAAITTARIVYKSGFFRI